MRETFLRAPCLVVHSSVTYEPDEAWRIRLADPADRHVHRERGSVAPACNNVANQVAAAGEARTLMACRIAFVHDSVGVNQQRANVPAKDLLLLVVEEPL